MLRETTEGRCVGKEGDVSVHCSADVAQAVVPERTAAASAADQRMERQHQAELNWTVNTKTQTTLMLKRHLPHTNAAHSHSAQPCSTATQPNPLPPLAHCLTMP